MVAISSDGVEVQYELLEVDMVVEELED